MDALADELGLDPAEVRRRNFIQEFPYTTATGLTYDSGNYARPLDRALELADYAGFEARRAEARGARQPTAASGCPPTSRSAGSRRRAVTAAIGVGARRLGASSTVRLHPTGKATVITGSSPHGQGHATSWSQIVAERARRPVRGRRGDPRRHGATRPTASARTARARWPSAGIAMHRSIGKVKEQGAPDRGPPAGVRGRRPRVDGRPLAGQGLARPRQDDPGAGRRRLGRGQSCPRAWSRSSRPRRSTTRRTSRSRSARTSAEVEIDGETGKVAIERYIAVDDCGNVINPMIVDGQVHGGIVAVDRAGALRGDGLRRGRPAAHRRRWSTT